MYLVLCQPKNDVYPAVIPAQAGIQFRRKFSETHFSLGTTRTRHFKIDGALANLLFELFINLINKGEYLGDSLVKLCRDFVTYRHL